jgi:hypothetical protein
MSRFSIGKTLPALICLVAGVAAHAAEPRVLVTVSKETTYITEPLRPDGYPDYLAALNQCLSRGVTPENNAAVPFWKAIGPKGIVEKHRERYFKMLGIAPLPEKGDYFVKPSDQISRYENKQRDDTQGTGAANGALEGQLALAMNRPWRKQEFPVWAEWLEINEKPMALLVEACRRPRRYEPLITDLDGKAAMISTLLPAAQESRGCMRALIARAMLRIGEGRADEAWSDLLDCHRFARLTDEGAFLVDGLVAITIERMALFGDQALLQHGKLTPGQIAKMRSEFDRLPRLTQMVDRLDLGERFSFLDSTLLIARKGPSSLSGLKIFGGDGTSKSIMDPASGLLKRSTINWDVTFRMVNSWYDRAVAAGRKPTRSERLKAMADFHRDFGEMAKAARGPDVLSLLMSDNRRAIASEWMGKMLLGLLFPASQAAQEAEDRMNMHADLVRLAFALAAYHADHGAYPAALSDLVPKYAKELPKDIFNNDGELRYAREGDGFLLYSLGTNGKDDGGKGYDDRKNNEDWDDLGVRIVAPARP